MRILLIQPNVSSECLAGDDTFILEPLALEYIGAGVKEISETRLLDLRVEDRLEEMLEEFKPNIVGLTGYTVHVGMVKKIIKEIRGKIPEIKLVIGGHHATVAYQDYLDAKPDYIIRGEGVSAFRAIVEILQQKKTVGDFKDITFTKESDSLIVRQTVQEQLDQMPIPDRSLTKRYRSFYFSYWMNPVASVRSSSGCKFKCKFCSLWENYKGQYYIRDPQLVLSEIMGIEEPYVLFTDDESFLEPDNMWKLAELLLKNNVNKKYRMMARADTIVKNKELFALWRKAGLEQIFIGVESMNDAALKKLNKGTNVKINEEAIKYMKNIGVNVVTDFIIDQEFEKEDFRALRKYVSKLKLPSAVFTILTPLPGTQFYRDVEHKMIDKQTEHFDVMHTLLPTKIPLREFYKEFYKLYKKSGSFIERLKFIKYFSFADMISIIKSYGKVKKKLKKLYKQANI